MNIFKKIDETIDRGFDKVVDKMLETERGEKCLQWIEDHAYDIGAVCGGIVGISAGYIVGNVKGVLDTQRNAEQVLDLAVNSVAENGEEYRSSLTNEGRFISITRIK